MTFKSLWQQLLPQYDAREAQAVVRLALETLFGFTLTDLYTGALDRLNPAQTQQLSALMHRLKHGEPVQYVLGKAWFCGRPFIVNSHVLIPRPETEQLCQRLISLFNQPYCALQPPAPRHGLDIGTGSGCIAITLALGLDNIAMHAWDVSSDALLTARANAHCLGAQVDFVLQDALLAAENADNSPQYDFIVSNPPYICECEQADMAPQVWAHEPATALFVPNDQPLLFYQAIAHFAAKQLKSDGLLAFEINPLHADALYTLLYKGPFYDVEITPDHFGKQRFAWAKKQ